jgi:RNA recognition motif-containing protein
MDVKGTFAFIEFEEEVDAADAMRYMDGSSIGERRISVRPCGPPRNREERFGGGGGPGGYPDRGGYRGGFGGGGGGGGGERGPGGFGGDRGGERFSGPPMDRPRNPPGVAYGFRVEVENIGEKTSWQDLKDFGRQAGPSIKYADIFHNEKGKSGYEETQQLTTTTTNDDVELRGRSIRLLRSTRLDTSN